MNAFATLLLASSTCMIVACSGNDDVGSASDTGAFLVDSGHETEGSDSVSIDTAADDSGVLLDAGDSPDAAIGCKFAAVTATPPCKYVVGGCSDGHSYALVCDASSCACEVDDVLSGKSADLVTCQTADTEAMNTACGWDLVLPGD